jgi:hypothetical protein
VTGRNLWPVDEPAREEHKDPTSTPWWLSLADRWADVRQWLARSGWPRWVLTPHGYPLGSKWHLTRKARIVLEGSDYGTLTLVDRSHQRDRFTLDAGTTLTLVHTYDPDLDEFVRGLDAPLYYEFCQGSAARTYRIDEGPWAGTRLTFSADPSGGRDSDSERWAHAAIVPAKNIKHRPVSATDVSRRPTPRIWICQPSDQERVSLPKTGQISHANATGKPGSRAVWPVFLKR